MAISYNFSHNTANSTSVSDAFGTAAAGDLLIALVSSNNVNLPVLSCVGASPTWVKVEDITYGGSTRRTTIWYAVALGSETSVVATPTASARIGIELLWVRAPVTFNEVYVIQAATVGTLGGGHMNTASVHPTGNGEFYVGWTSGDGTNYTFAEMRVGAQPPDAGDGFNDLTVSGILHDYIAAHGNNTSDSITYSVQTGIPAYEMGILGVRVAAIVAPSNTVAPAVTGTAQVGQTLSCTTGTWTGAPTPTYTYQWKAGGVSIGGATNSTFVLTNTQHGSTITCAVTATNTGGNATATSNTTASVIYAAPTNSVLPTITGTAQVGQTLTAGDGTWTSLGNSFSYVWKAGGVAIGGATASTYVLTNTEHGSAITLTVTATNDGGNASATSSATSSVVYAAPTNSVLPTISGTAKVGQTLTAGDGTWTSLGNSFSYVWKAGGVAIGGATASTFVLTNTQHAALITLTVTATNDGGNASATSAATSAVVYANPINNVAPAITGTAKVGRILTCSTGTWTGTGIAYTYQWKRAGVSIGGATSSTYTVVVADVGLTLTCTVTATNDGAAVAATSAATAAVTANTNVALLGQMNYDYWDGRSV